MEYVLDQKESSPNTPMVVNLSFSGPQSDLVDSAVESLVAAGLIVVAAAGDGVGLACGNSPGSAENAITVGAMQMNFPFFETEAQVWNTKLGDCVDIFAPAQDIATTGIESTTANATLTGTSASAAFVSGVVAMVRKTILLSWLLLASVCLSSRLSKAHIPSSLLKKSTWTRTLIGNTRTFGVRLTSMLLQLIQRWVRYCPFHRIVRLGAWAPLTSSTLKASSYR